MLQNSIQQTGTSGIIEQDDADTWPQIMRNARGAVSKGMTLKYQALSGHHKPEGWYGEGRVYPGFTKDDTQWDWWMAYYNQITAEDRKSVVKGKSVSVRVDLGGRRIIKKKKKLSTPKKD